jgi:hypothetical protein
MRCYANAGDARRTRRGRSNLLLPLEDITMNIKRFAIISVAAYALLVLAGCTQEQQNKVQRDIQNWTGTNGVLEIYAGDKLVRRFMKIDKLSTALGTDDNKPRPYRYGYGVLDENFNMVADSNEKRVYFEVSDYASNYVFFENPR